MVTARLGALKVGEALGRPMSVFADTVRRPLRLAVAQDKYALQLHLRASSSSSAVVFADAPPSSGRSPPLTGLAPGHPDNHEERSAPGTHAAEDASQGRQKETWKR